MRYIASMNVMCKEILEFHQNQQDFSTNKCVFTAEMLLGGPAATIGFYFQTKLQF